MFQLSSTCQRTVCAWFTRVVNARLNVLPRANMRVPSLPGVSASIGSPLADAAGDGAEGAPHFIASDADSGAVAAAAFGAAAGASSPLLRLQVTSSRHATQSVKGAKRVRRARAER